MQQIKNCWDFWRRVCYDKYRLTDLSILNVEWDVANNIKSETVLEIQHKNNENSFIIILKGTSLLTNLQYQMYVICICYNKTINYLLCKRNIVS